MSQNVFLIIHIYLNRIELNKNVSVRNKVGSLCTAKSLNYIYSIQVTHQANRYCDKCVSPRTTSLCGYVC